MAKRYQAKNKQVFLLCTQHEKIKFSQFLLEVEAAIEKMRELNDLPIGWNSYDDNALQISRWVLPLEYGGLDNDIAEHQLTTVNKALRKLDLRPINIQHTGTANPYEVKTHMDKARARLKDWRKHQEAKKDLEDNVLFEVV